MDNVLPLMVTGHRPKSLGGYSPALMKRLGAFARTVLPEAVDLATKCIYEQRRCLGLDRTGSDPCRTCNCGYAACHVVVRTGMALGWDQAVAAACIDQGVRFHAYIPSSMEEQQSWWPAPSRRAYWRLLRDASEVTFVKAGATFGESCLARNATMARGARLCVALWNGAPGGTSHGVGCADKEHVPVLNVWRRWLEYSKRRFR